MSLAAGACAAALAYFAFLAAERAVLDRARRRIGTVVHVNGTRGKSETTRLLAAALRASGRPTLAKTTGTESRLILEDGSERRLRRLGAADVREQRGLLLRAARAGASCLVAECMAVSAEAQAASDAFLSPDMLLVTNARPDHEAELGDPEATAAVFAGLVPRGGTVLTADGRLFPLLEREAAARGAKAYLSSPIEEPGLEAIPDNAGLALLAAELLGLDPAAALEGMKLFRPDPGAFALRSLGAAGGGSVLVADALAANDPESAALLLEGAPRPRGGSPLLFVAARPDRPDRTLAFARWAAGQGGRYERIVVAGPLGWRAARAFGRRVRRIPRRGAVEFLRALPGGSVVHATGNWKGLGPALAEAARRESPRAAVAAAAESVAGEAP